MTFLPIVERELRVAARRPGTYWVRFGVAGTLLGLLAGFYGISVGFGLDWLEGGQNLFLVLQWCALPFLTGFGVFLTADALSEEKREGTLGLLFLTDLRGHDVVLGKLAAQAARGFWAALAALPVVGLTILLGGVSGTWFLRVILVIGNSLFLSLALGLLMSAASRNGFKAVNGTLLLVLMLHVGVLGVDWIRADFDASRFTAQCSLLSPAHLLFAAMEIPGLTPLSAGAFWGQWGTQHALGWVALLGAALILPRSWQQRSERGPSAGIARWSARWRFGGPAARARFRRRWLAGNAVFWLAMRDRGLARALVLGVGVSGVAIGWWAGLSPAGKRGEAARDALATMIFLAEWGLILWTAASAAGFFSELKRSGSGELILATPATPEQILNAQQRSWWRTFGWFIVLLAGVEAYLTWERQQATGWSAAASPQAVGEPPAWAQPALALAGLGLGELAQIMNLLAVCALGRWWALAGRKPWVAVVRAIGLGLVLPAAVLVVVQWVGWLTALRFMGMRNGNANANWFNVLQGALSLAVAVATLGKDLWLIRWAHRRVRERMRIVLAEVQGGRFRPVAKLPTGRRRDVVVGA